ncbi:MAG: hypothetical protein FJX62_11735 [Alphaproteobacteria bacterium]|nr:hypothetical protein [Alphaproteobacteria bacterium]
MMTALAFATSDIRRLRLSRAALARGLVAGSVWGATMTVGLTALTAWQCGVICTPEVAVNAVLSFAAGIAGIGPVAAYGGADR